METGTIYQIDSSGGLSRMRPSAPESEASIQRLIAAHPDLIGGDGELLLIRREQPIADAADAGGRWSLDHLFVTREGVPVLVEVKRASDTRIRREVVGQMLDYAANAVAWWPAGGLADAFAATCASAGEDAADRLAIFLGQDADADGFWERVDANVRAGRLRLVFVADLIPPELARVVEFLDEQMTADVRAVELRWFSGGDGSTTLVPRVVGASERVTERKRAARGAGGGEREEGRRAFWTALLAEMRGGATGFERMAAPTRGDLQVGAGPGMWFKFSVTRDACDVVLYLDRAGEPEWARSFLSRLKARREEIDTAFGDGLVFDAMPERRAARLIWTAPVGWGDTAEWPSGLPELADRMTRLRSATTPLIEAERARPRDGHRRT